MFSGGEIVSLDRELTGIVFAINLHPAGGQVIIIFIIIFIIFISIIIFIIFIIIIWFLPSTSTLLGVRCPLRYHVDNC